MSNTDCHLVSFLSVINITVVMIMMTKMKMMMSKMARSRQWRPSSACLCHHTHTACFPPPFSQFEKTDIQIVHIIKMMMMMVVMMMTVMMIMMSVSNSNVKYNNQRTSIIGFV